jgi:phenylacetate-CoA ligase
MIWNPEYETMPRDKLRELQLKRLNNVIKWAYNNVPFYQDRFAKAGIKPGLIKSINDLAKLPFTTKEDLRDNYPFGFLAIPLDQVVRVHASSGTTGQPIVVGYTRGDLNTWAELTARIATAGGATARDIAQISFGYGLFTGGFGLHAGLERIGATVVPMSAGNTERQILIMQDFKVTVLVSTPSYALYIAEVGQEMGVDFSKLPLRVGLFGAEPCSEKMRQEIEERLGISATDNYGLTEVIGPGVSGECQEKNGLHINEDHFIPEIIDPSTGEVLPPGEEGELVFTTLTKEAFPVIRYRTRDISALIEEPCPCGRTTIRMKKVRARTDDMLIVRGVNIFPSQIENVLMEVEGTKPHYQIIVERKDSLDTIQVKVEVCSEIFQDTMKKLVELEKAIAEKLYAVLGLKVDVKLVEPKTLERTTGKSRRVVDLRKLD